MASADSPLPPMEDHTLQRPVGKNNKITVLGYTNEKLRKEKGLSNARQIVTNNTASQRRSKRKSPKRKSPRRAKSPKRKSPRRTKSHKRK